MEFNMLVSNTEMRDTDWNTVSREPPDLDAIVIPQRRIDSSTSFVEALQMHC